MTQAHTFRTGTTGMAENKGFAEIAARMGVGGKTEKGDPHDQVVLRARALAHAIGLANGLLPADLHPIRVRTELEYAITDRDFVDIAVFCDKLAFIMEIKSEGEAQTASGWTRQVKRYEKLSGVRALLVVAHDLGDVQSKYLQAANISTLDLRRNLRAADR